MSTPITFFYDFVSPYSHFAFAQRHDIRARTGREIEFKPIDILKVMDMVGNVPTSVICKPKRAYLGQDLDRWARKLEVPLAFHPLMGRFASEPLRMAAHQAGNDLEAFSAAVFAAVWVEAAPLDDEQAMLDWFAQKEPRFAEIWRNRENGTDLCANANTSAASQGVFGVPFFRTDKGDFFGNDRVEIMIEELAT